MVKLQKHKEQFRLTIPKDIVKLMGWNKGTEIVFIQDASGNLLIKEIKKKK